MVVVKELPPKHIYDRAREQFGVDFEKGVVFSYGDTLYARYSVDPDLFEHESTHGKIQIAFPGGPDAWWERYFTDAQFRFEQELIAYRAQYRFMKTQVKDRNQQNTLLWGYARDLSGKMYGNIVLFSEAIKLIKE